MVFPSGVALNKFLMTELNNPLAATWPLMVHVYQLLSLSSDFSPLSVYACMEQSAVKCFIHIALHVCVTCMHVGSKSDGTLFIIS